VKYLDLPWKICSTGGLRSYVCTSDLSKAVSSLSYRPTVVTTAYKDSRQRTNSTQGLC